ncbi:MAG: SBBP repeat-containing protein, partial [Pyrinomonadaceae bacterium]
MLIGSKISDPKFYSALLILAGLCLSLVVFSPAKTHAAAATFDYKIGPTPAENLNRADLVQSPLLFEQNQGQSDRTAKFIARGNGYTLYLTRTEAVFSLKAPFTRTRYQNLEAESKGMTAPDASQNDILRMSFTGANRRPAVSGETEAITKSNYYRGSTRIENIPNYRSVNYSDLYDGVDAVFYGDEANQLEYDFVIAPNADANQIQLTFQGAECLAIDGEGDLAIKTAQAEFIQPKPFAYLEIDGQRHEVPSRYVLTNDSTVKFELGPYDHSKQLVIDPKVSYSTYLGGTGNAIDVVQSIKVDAAGNVYATGGTESSNFPTLNPRTSDGSVAVFIAKISPNGQTLLYTTFLDGSGDDGFGEFFHGDRGNDLALDASGNVYVAGQTESDDFPISTNAYQTYRACNRTFGICAYPEEAFVTKLSPTGTMIYSTYLGGRNTDFANGIAVDSAGKAYVTGGTSSGLTFPKKNEYEGTGISGALADGFLTVFTADGSDITYSTGLGGNNRDDCNDIAIDSSNNVYITGETESDGQFPVKNAFQGLSGGGIDAFVAKFNPSLSGEASLIYSTFLGGAGTDEGLGIAVDAAGSAHVTGSTGSFNFPLQVPIRSTNQINEAFVTVLDPSGISLDASTFLGGSGQDRGNDIEVDAFGNIYVTGNTTSSDFPLALPFQSTLAGGQDA